MVSAHFRLERTSNMQNVMELELVGSISGGFEVPVRQLNHEQLRIDVPISIPRMITPGDYQLTFQASGPLDAKPDQTAITSATVTLHVK